MDSAAEGSEEEDDSSFADLVQQLSAVHEHQQETLRGLTQENASLRQRLASLEAPAVSGLGPRTIRFSIPEVEHKVTAPLPDEDVEPEVEEEDVYEQGSLTSKLAAAETRKATELLVADLWPEWETAPGDVLRHVTRASPTTTLLAIDDSTGQAMTVANRCHQKLIVRPNSVVRLAWDFLSCIMVCYDVVTIPLMVVCLEKGDFLGGGNGPFTEAMDFVTTFFWTVDVPCSFLTGYHNDGVIEMRAIHIAMNYFKTWFTFDILVVAIDWAMVYMTTSGRSAHALGLFRIGKSVRMARILRTLRLLRFIKLQRVLFECLERISSESIRTGLNIFMAVLFIFGINHYLACGWFLVGHVGWSLDAPNWIEMNRMQERTVVYAYCSSLHWSMTQFTPAGMEIRPYNIAERVYSIICLVFALITFSSFLGSITASITTLRKHSTETGRQQIKLRTYLAKNKVSAGLSKHIWSYLQQNHYSHQTRGRKENLEVLGLLPPHLFGALHLELYGPYLTRAPFFYQYTALCRQGIIEVCSHGFSELSLVCGDYLFTSGKLAQKMYFTASGYMKYEHQFVGFQHVLGPGSWASEPVLWVRWVHVAPMIASTSCEVLALDSEKFRSVVGCFQHSAAFVRMYAQLFRNHLLDMGIDGLSDVIADIKSLEDLTQQAYCHVMGGGDDDVRISGSKETGRGLRPLMRTSRKSRFSGFWKGPVMPMEKHHESWWQRGLRGASWSR